MGVTWGKKNALFPPLCLLNSHRCAKRDHLSYGLSMYLHFLTVPGRMEEKADEHREREREKYKRPCSGLFVRSTSSSIGNANLFLLSLSFAAFMYLHINCNTHFPLLKMLSVHNTQLPIEWVKMKESLNTSNVLIVSIFVIEN